MRLEAISPLGNPLGKIARVAGFPALCERSDIGCLLVNAAVDGAGIIAAAGAALGVVLPHRAGAMLANGNRLAIWLTPRSWLLHCSLEDEFALAQEINSAFPDKSVHAACFTDYLCWLEFFGPEAEDILREGGFLSLEKLGLPVGHAKRTLVAGIPVVLVRLARDSWLIGVERSRARYFTDWLASCSGLSK